MAGKGLEKYLLTTWGHVYSVAPRKREERPDARRHLTHDSPTTQNKGED